MIQTIYMEILCFTGLLNFSLECRDKYYSLPMLLIWKVRQFRIPANPCVAKSNLTEPEGPDGDRLE